MKNLATILVIFVLLVTLWLTNFLISYGSCASTNEILQWWWHNGSGHTANIFFSFGLFAFVLLMSTWLILISQTIYGKPAEYVWIGSGLLRDTDYYYDLKDPEKKRFKVNKRVGEYGFNFTTSIDILYTCHCMIRYGPQPQNAERLLAHNFQSQLMLVIFQYSALVFGFIGIYEIMSQHASFFEYTTISYTIFITPFLVLFTLHLLGLVFGQFAFQKKRRSFKTLGNRKIKSCELQPGDSFSLRLLKKSKKRLKSGNKPFSAFYRGEWVDNEGLTLSLVFGFKVAWSLREAVKILDDAASHHGHIECIIMPDYKIRPKILKNQKDITML